MVKNPFAYLMIATFLAAVATMLAGVLGMSGADNPCRLARSNMLMALRVLLCMALLLEIIVYTMYYR